MKKNTVKIYTEMNIMGAHAPIDIYIEKRKDLRVSFRGNSIIVRLPNHIDKEQQRELYKKAQQWIKEKARQKPSLLFAYIYKEYHNRKIVVMGEEYTCYTSEADRNSAKISRKGNDLYLTLPINSSARERNNLSKKLLSKTFASIFKSEIQSEVFKLNDAYFHKEINSVRLKYNKSNWGSCSAKSNINLSTRLLLVPEQVRSYVIVHELSHLYEMNHSKRFWAVVAKACPNYQYYENWLNENGSKIDF